jgi:NO-binding membrane sensor protein with MHYT domain
VVTVHNFSYGLLNPVLGYAVSCLGAFLGLRCVTRARAYTGAARARWLIVAAIALGATGVWAMHFIAMLGYTIPGQQISYNVPLTIVSMLIAIAVVGVGLFIVGYGDGSLRRLVTGGVIVGIGVAAMHYLGMSAMIMPDSLHYNAPLFALSVLIAIVAGTAALWAGTQVRSTTATIGAALIMGVAVSGMHYTGMAALHLTAGSMAATGGSSGMSFLVPLLVGITIVTFAVTLVISLSPTEDEIHEDARLRDRIAGGFSASAPGSPPPPQPQAQAQPSLWTPQSQSQSQSQPQPQAQPSLWTPHNQQPQNQLPQAPQQPQTPPKALPTRRPSSDALAGRNRTPRQPG